MFTPGQRVRIIRHPVFKDLIGKLATVVGYTPGLPYPVVVEVEGLPKGHENRFVNVKPKELELILRTNRKIAPGTQTHAILSHLVREGRITGLVARSLYRVEALPRRISDIREAGHSIKARWKVDPTGKRYREYSLANVKRAS